MTQVKHRYFRVSNGFTNGVIYIRVPLDKVDEVNRRFEYFEDRADGSHCNWTNDRRARMPYMAIDWDDYARIWGHCL